MPKTRKTDLSATRSQRGGWRRQKPKRAGRASSSTAAEQVAQPPVQNQMVASHSPQPSTAPMKVAPSVTGAGPTDAIGSTQQESTEMAQDKQTILDTMWNTVLNHKKGYKKSGGSLASNTYLVCKIDTVPELIIRENDTGGKHAEQKLIDDYLENKTTATTKVTVYMNNSPCKDCAGILKTCLEKNKGIDLTLYVTHLYNIKRKSCQDSAERHIKDITNKEHAANYKRLRDLMNLGDNRCKIEAFTRDVWRELHKVMDLTEDFQQRITTYGTTNTMKSHDRSRKDEDSNIKRDLEHIEANADPQHGIPRKNIMFGIPRKKIKLKSLI